MTEEIIIDCAFYKDGVCASPINKTCEYCKNIDVNKCYHKQLKRSEQENKELKEVKEQLKKWNDENLKRQDDMQLWIDLAEEQRKKYRSALEEIREMVLYCEDEYNCDRCKYHDNCLIDDDKFPDFSKALVNKINEVLQ